MLTIYKASAGSGKTFRLTLEYIKLLIGVKNPETQTYSLALNRKNAHEQILAITFTNKATAEMKRRIVKELSTIAATPAKSGFIDELQDFFHTRNIDEISRAAYNALYNLLFFFSSFNVSTIDSFFQLVLRSFAAEIDRPDDFEVSIDDTFIMTQALNSVIDKISQKELKVMLDWMKKFMTTKIEDGASFNLLNRNSHLLEELSENIIRMMDETYRKNYRAFEDYLAVPDDLSKFEDEIRKSIRAFKKKLQAYAKQIRQLVESENIELFFKCQKRLEEWGEKNYKADYFDKAEKIAADPIKNAFKKTTSGSKGARAKLTRTIDPSNELITLITEAFTYFYKFRRQYFTYKVILERIPNLGLLSEVIREMHDYCRKNDVILISDTNDLLSKIIKSSPVPFVYDRIGVRLHNFLIDEFQDTSDMQWQNISPLFIESMASRNDNLIIGDEKQCIYRFRNSSPELLGHEVEQQIKDTFGSSDDAVCVRGNILAENCNWRSAPNVIRFNNTIFHLLGLRTNLFGEDNAYRRVIQDIPDSHKDKGGFAKVQLCAKDAIRENIIRDIKNLLTIYSPKDIAILVRENSDIKDVAEIIESAIESDNEELKLPPVTMKINNAVKLKDSPAVKIIVNTLRLISTPDMAEKQKQNGWKAKTAQIKRLIFDINRRYEDYLTTGRAIDNSLITSLIEAGKEDKRISMAMKHERIDANDIAETVDIIIETLDSGLKEKDNIFIAAFQDVVNDYSEHNNQDIISFLEWWDCSGIKATVSFPEDIDAITIMTIHKSKGLEYKAVLLPYCDWDFPISSDIKKKNYAWISTEGKDLGISPPAPPFLQLKLSKELRETAFEPEYRAFIQEQRIDALNISYVAFTRAIDVLIAYVRNDAPGETFYDVLSPVLQQLKQYGLDSVEATDEEKELLACPVFNADGSIITLGCLSGANSEQKNRHTKPDKTFIMPVYQADIDRSRSGMVINLPQQDNLNLEDARQKGIFLHDVLSDVDTPDSLDYAFKKRVVAVGLQGEPAEKWRKELENAINAPQVYHWFYDFKDVATEQNIVIDGEGARRPDRIVFTSDGHVDVVDYKFGDEDHKKYHKQVQKYVNTLRDMGFKNVRGYIWFPDKMEIITIDNGMTENEILFDR